MAGLKTSPAPVITTLNLKGGVGKTHTNWLLASVALEQKQRVLVIDLDAQGNLSQSLLPYSDAPGVEVLLDPSRDPDIKSLIQVSRFAGIDVIPASPKLFPWDNSSQQEWEKHELQDCLREAIQEVQNDYDYVLLDCPPRLSLTSMASLCAADFVLIPLEAADWGARGVMQVREAIQFVKEHHNPSLHLLGFLLSRYKTRRVLQRSYAEKLRQTFPDQVLDTVIPELANFEKSVSLNIPITSHAPRSREATIARDLFAEVNTRIQHARPQ